MISVAGKTETKTVILLSPQSLDSDLQLLQSLHIKKSAKGVEYTIVELDGGILSRFYSKLGQACMDAINRFSKVPLALAEQNINKLVNHNRAGISKKVFVHKAMMRHMQQLFESVKPFAGIISWYHKTTNDGKKYTTGPCTFSSFKPQLAFEVLKSENKLLLQVSFVINNYRYNANAFKRYHFFIESSNEYFLLSYNDYQTLQWLEQAKVEQYANEAAAFSQNVLQKLEANYPVNRNNYFEKKSIDKLPVNRVLLSELNNSFLMLTPQWLYDGFLVEGPWKETYETTAEGEQFVIHRNKEIEGKLIEQLTALHPNFASQRNGYYYLSFAEAQKKQWFLKSFYKLLDLGVEPVGMDMLSHFRYSPFKVDTSLKVKSQEGNEALLEVTVSFGKEQVPLNILQKMLLAGQRAIMLNDGSMGVLSDEWLQQYAALIKHGKIKNQDIEVTKYFALTDRTTDTSTTDTSGDLLKQLIKTQWWEKWRQWQNGEDIYTVPATVNAQLRPYQKKGFDWLSLLAEAGAGACLADDMGLGKTLQTISFLAHYIQNNPGSSNIIICPSSLIYNWQQEFQKFSPHLSAVVYHGASRSVESLKEKDQIIITSYGTFRSDAAHFSEQEYGVAVIDESHNIKNPVALTTVAVNSLNAAIRIALSGTPVINNTFDLFSQLNFVLPGMFGGKDFFKREYADPIDNYRDEEKILALQKLTAPFILRRTKEQVAQDLPEKTETILWCNMGSRQQSLYNEIKDQVRSNLFLNIENEGLNKSKLAVLQGMLKLRQICNSPMLLPPEEHGGCNESVKTEVLVNELTELLVKHKVLVFSQFSSMLDLLANECNRKGIAYYHFNGKTPPAERSVMVNKFQEDDNTTNLFLISLKAGNTGLNLTAADYVFLFDPWWNKAVEQQAIDRTHRIGQTKNVFAYKMICKGTIEEKIVQLQEKKKKLAEELVGEDEGFLKSLTEEDVAYLFS